MISNSSAWELLISLFSPNDINGGDGSAVSLQLLVVGTRHCRLLYIISAQPELILYLRPRKFKSFRLISIAKLVAAKLLLPAQL